MSDSNDNIPRPKPEFRNSDHIILMGQVIDYADKFGDAGVGKTRALSYIFTSFTSFKGYLKIMIDSGLVVLVRSPNGREHIVATDKGRQYARLVRKLDKLLVWRGRPDHRHVV